MLVLNKKNIIGRTIIILFITINIFAIKSFAMVEPTSDFYINDYANILNEETKDYILRVNKSLYSQTGAQIVVVTVQNLEGDSIEEYATRLFRNFGIGDKSKNNGLLLLLALEERQFRVEVGYGLEGILPDAKTGRIQDEYMVPFFKQDNWNEGILNGFNVFSDIIAKEYNVEIGLQDVADYDYEEELSPLENMITCVAVISWFVGLIGAFCITNNIASEKLMTKLGILYLVILSIVLSSLINLNESLQMENNISQVVEVICLNFIGIAAIFIGVVSYFCRGLLFFFGGFSGDSSGGGGGSSGGGGSTRSF